MHENCATVLLVDDEPAFRARYAELLSREPSFAVATAPDAETALALARRLRPQCIVSDLHLPGMDGFELCRRVRAEPALAGTMVLILSGSTDIDTKIEGLELGVDDYVTKPVEYPELLARVRHVLRTQRLQDQLRADKVTLEALHDEVRQSFDQLLSLLHHMLDLRRPGAAQRGARLAEAAAELAQRFDIPKEFRRDLELAARLHEIGLAIDPVASTAPPGWLEPAQWRSLVLAKTTLEQVQGLRGVAELVGALQENWDGSGFPEHAQRGQIPLRSRLLRVLIDFFAATAPKPGGRAALSVEQALEALRMHSGTWYDPLVVSQLQVLVTGAPHLARPGDVRRVPIAELQVGMVLVEDLCTSSGVKLLSAGAALKRGSLELIRRRDASDPVIHMPLVRMGERR
jgi:putative two-component system response regulator